MSLVFINIFQQKKERRSKRIYQFFTNQRALPGGKRQTVQYQGKLLNVTDHSGYNSIRIKATGFQIMLAASDLDH